MNSVVGTKNNLYTFRKSLLLKPKRWETSIISTSWLNSLLNLHRTPIKQVFYLRSIGIPYLGVRFALDMLSVLIEWKCSYPAMPLRDNRYTRDFLI